jgi:hypothetical protein
MADVLAAAGLTAYIYGVAGLTPAVLAAAGGWAVHCKSGLFPILDLAL